MHFGVEINLGDFERLVPEPTLNFHQVEARAQPVHRRRLAKSVEIMILTHGPREGRNGLLPVGRPSGSYRVAA